MNIRHEPVWLSPEQIVEIAFAQARVVLLNEAHNGPRRCIRTRQLGLSILPTAHQMGVRHLAMEALYPEFAEQCNRTRHVPLDGRGYLAQPEMQTLIQAALDSGWTLLAYEADPRQWLAACPDMDVELSKSFALCRSSPILVGIVSSPAAGRTTTCTRLALCAGNSNVRASHSSF